MDLTRFDALTRKVLESEAEKRGIKNVAARGRTELVRLILRHEYGSGAGRILKELAVGVLGGRKWGRAASTSTHTSTATSTSPVARGAATSTTTAAGVSVSQGAEVRAEIVLPVEERDPDEFALEGVARTRSFVEEPIRTHSMARLLAVQGHRERALAIYEELLAQNSADGELGREAAALRDGHALTFAPGELPLPPEKPRRELPASEDRIACEARGEGTLAVRWSVSDAGLVRARLLLGAPGELAVRIVSIRPDPARVVRSDITEHGPISADGEWTTKLGTPGVRSFASVGLRDAHRFVSIVHARTD